MRQSAPAVSFLPFLLLSVWFASPVAVFGQNSTDVAAGQDMPGHYRVFTADGEPSSLADIVLRMAEVDVVLVGEIHTDPVGHWIEAALFEEAVALTRAGEGTEPGRPLALSLEMFESDVQGILDEYLQDLITEDQFKASSRPWDHYDQDYRPMVEMAKAMGLPVLAANAPRRYVNRVSRLGPDALNDLSDWAKGTLPPLPYPSPTEAYREEWNALMSNMTMAQLCPVPEVEAEEDPEQVTAEIKVEEPSPHAPPPAMPTHSGSFMENGIQAQTLWDASMAYNIQEFLKANPGGLVVHMVGGFHVKNFTGTPEKVQFYRPGTPMLVVHMDTAEDFRTFDPELHAGRGDFVILTDQALDLYYERNCQEAGS